jgi:hypothetical protein
MISEYFDADEDQRKKIIDRILLQAHFSNVESMGNDRKSAENEDKIHIRDVTYIRGDESE